MLRKLLELHTGPLKDLEFLEIMTQVTQYIRIQHLSHSLRTSLTYAIQTATLTYLLFSNSKTEG